jgi:hypothetical protein
MRQAVAEPMSATAIVPTLHNGPDYGRLPSHLPAACWRMQSLAS